MEMVVTSGAKATLLTEAAAAHPEEACGLLLGQGSVISQALPVRNVHGDPRSHFELDPAALIAAHRAARTLPLRPRPLPQTRHRPVVMAEFGPSWRAA